MLVPSNDTPPIFLAVSRAVAVAALPVVDPELPDTFPVTSPTKDVAVKAPELELNVKFVPDLGARLPVAPVVNSTLQVV